VSPESEVPDDLIEIHDPEIDPARIMAEIRERLRRRAAGPGAPFPTFGASGYPGEPDGEDYDPDLYYHLRRANELYARLDIEPVLAPSPLTRLPVLGRLWRLIRRQAHNLVLFYLAILARQQLAVNRHLVGVLNRMAVQLEVQRRQVRALEEEVRRLGGGGGCASP